MKIELSSGPCPSSYSPVSPISCHWEPNEDALYVYPCLPSLNHGPLLACSPAPSLVQVFQSFLHGPYLYDSIGIPSSHGLRDHLNASIYYLLCRIFEACTGTHVKWFDSLMGDGRIRSHPHDTAPSSCPYRRTIFLRRLSVPCLSKTSMTNASSSCSYHNRGLCGSRVTCRIECCGHHVGHGVMNLSNPNHRSHCNPNYCGVLTCRCCRWILTATHHHHHRNALSFRAFFVCFWGGNRGSCGPTLRDLSTSREHYEWYDQLREKGRESLHTSVINGAPALTKCLGEYYELQVPWYQQFCNRWFHPHHV